jgi:hypothetical protein
VTVSFNLLAEKELNEAAQYFELESEGLGAAFLSRRSTRYDSNSRRHEPQTPPDLLGGPALKSSGRVLMNEADLLDYWKITSMELPDINYVYLAGRLSFHAGDDSGFEAIRQMRPMPHGKRNRR